MKTLLLIDGNSILNRAFYGIRPLTTSSGLFTHAVYGMMNIVLKHIEERKPDYAAVAFDLKAPTFRHERYDGYKATRKGMPPELAVQLPYAKKCMTALGLTELELAGYEADDILGTCAAFGGDDPELSVYVLTGDRDSFQLIRDNVTVLLASTGETKEFHRAEFSEKYRVTPEQFVDVKALMGDSSDNIPGVAGIGEKTAVSLIYDYGSLDGLYEALQDAPLTPSVKKKLSEGRDSAYLSRFLAEIKCDSPLGISLCDLEYKGYCKKELHSLLTELELFSLAKRLGVDGDNCGEDKEEKSSSDTPATAPATECSLCELLLRELAEISCDIEGNTLSVYDGETEYSVSFSDISEIKPLFEKKDRSVTVYDSKKIYLTLGDVASKLFDVSLAAYVVDSSEGNYDLARLSFKYLGYGTGEGFRPSRALYELHPVLLKKLEESSQLRLYTDIELPLASVLADMEKEGFKIDREGLARYSAELDKMCAEYKEAIYFEAGKEFNINSTKQLGQVLFDELKLPARKKTKTGYSTDADTLEKLRPYHTIIDRILEYRKVAKLRSTYCDGLLKVADSEGRIHSSFNQTVTATGRLSSSEPNLQNIPIRSELGRKLREFFIPKSDDHVLIDADYSQIELRVLAAVSGDINMISAFNSGEDIHTTTAASVFGVPLGAVTDEQRKRAKAVNFGIVYGIGAFSLGNDIGVSKYEADRYIKNYLARYPEVSAYLNDTVEAASRDGYVTTVFGRRRYIPELSSSKKMMKAFGERVAMNSPIQGAAADIIKIAMINVARALKESSIDAKLILQVHDELILEARRSCAKEAANILKREMERAVEFPVPLSVDIGIGDNWLQC